MVAMRRYQLAFGGTNCAINHPQMPYWGEPEWECKWKEENKQDQTEWTRRSLEEKKIWIDYDRDILFVDFMSRPRLYSKCAPVEQTFKMLDEYALQEVKSIKRLAVGDGGRHASSALRRGLLGDERRSPPLPGLKIFEGLSELFLDDSFSDPIGHAIRAEEELREGAPPPRLARRLPPPLESGDITVAIEEAKKGRSGWPDRTPTVKIVRGEEWQALLREMS